MSKIYRLIHNAVFPRFLKEMKNKLQFDQHNRVGDWFLDISSTIIRIYGFHEAPYILPAFLTPIFFALEFIRQRLVTESKHFIKRNKYQVSI